MRSINRSRKTHGVQRTTSGLVRACHPWPTVVVTCISVALATAVGRDAAGIALVAVTVLVGQLSIGWSNDWLDARRDVASHRRDKPVATGDIAVPVVRVAALSALVLCIPLSFLNGVSAGWAHLGLVGSGWAYNAGLKRTLLSWVPYAVGFGLLPAFVTLGLPGAPWPTWWATASASLLAVGAHFANVLPDIDDDLAHGVNGLPQRLGTLWAGILAICMLLAASALLLLNAGGGPAPVIGAVTVGCLSAVGLVSIRQAANLPRTFFCAMAIAAIDVLVFVGVAGAR